jgi:hypothetical protein
MPGTTSAGGGYTCQVCGTTFDTEQHLIEHGNEQHPGKAVIWGATGTTSTAATSTEEAIRQKKAWSKKRQQACCCRLPTFFTT